MSSPGQSDSTILISCNLCHPYQVNDSLSGVAVVHLLYEELKNEITISPIFSPLVQNLELSLGYLIMKNGLKNSLFHVHRDGWFAGPITLQQSLLDIHILMLWRHRFTREGVKTWSSSLYCIMEFAMMFCNVLYSHTLYSLESWDVRRVSHQRGYLENLDVELVESMAKVQLEVLARLDEELQHLFCWARESNIFDEVIKTAEKSRPAQDYVPIPLFKGPIFLTGYDLYVDFRENHKLLMNINRLMLLMNGLNSCWDIAYSCGMDFADVDDFIKRLEGYQLVKISIGWNIFRNFFNL